MADFGRRAVGVDPPRSLTVAISLESDYYNTTFTVPEI